MAITLNKYAIRCEEIAIVGGKITPLSSARTSIYDISRNWRTLVESTNAPSANTGSWSQCEEAAMDVIISALTYLQRIGCKNIEQLLRDTVQRHARQNNKVS